MSAAITLKTFLSKIKTGDIITVNQTPKTASLQTTTPDYIADCMIGVLDNLAEVRKEEGTPDYELLCKTVSYTRGFPQLYAPSSIFIYNSQIYVGSSSRSYILVLNFGLNVVDSIDVGSTVRSMYIDSDIIYFSTYTNRLAAYDIATGSFLWDRDGESTYETSSRGDWGYSMSIHMNGDDLLVARQYGVDNDRGGIVKVDKQTGDYVETIFKYETDGFMLNGETYRPTIIKSGPLGLYIYNYGKDEIGIVSPVDYTVKAVINRPPTILTPLYILDFLITEDGGIFLSSSMKAFFTTDPQTGDFKERFGRQRYEYNTLVTTYNNSIYDPRSFARLDEHHIVVTDNANHTVSIMHIGDYMRYKLETQVDCLLAKYDIDENGYYKVPVWEKDTSNVYVAKIQ